MATKIYNDHQLAYWLQGFFEISGTNELNDEQIKKVVAVIDQIPAKNMGELSKFILKTLASERDPLTASQKISKKLEETFIHDIDPKYAGDQAHFQQTHDGHPPRPNRPYPPGMRC